MSELIKILRKNHEKKSGGLIVYDKINKEVICEISYEGKIKYICNDEKSEKKAFMTPNENYILIPHIPLNKSRYIIFGSGESGMGKSSLTYIFIQQTYQHITKRIFFISGTDIKEDENLKKLKYIKQIKGDKISEINIERDLKDSLIVFDDIDNYDFHDEAIHLMNKIYECGRKFKINIIYLSHITTKANESKIYNEVDIYITNKAKNNRMFETYLNLSKDVVNEIDKYLITDPFVIYNKVYDCVMTDKKIYKLN